MYKQFFGLTRNPFEISPDPYFYHPTPRHNEALANLHYGVGRRKGFIVITGEVGTGKTLLVRCLLSELRKNNIAFGYVFNPLLPVVEFFQYIMADFGLPYSGRTKTEMLLDLNRFLIQRHARGLITALVVDEAQALRTELLEEIRLLTNLETSQQKLLQIVLMGQPELEIVLDSPELRQLKQRVALRCQLQPLDEAQTHAYVLSRLERAGAAGGAADLLRRSAGQDLRIFARHSAHYQQPLRKFHGQRFCPRTTACYRRYGYRGSRRFPADWPSPAGRSPAVDGRAGRIAAPAFCAIPSACLRTVDNQELEGNKSDCKPLQ